MRHTVTGIKFAFCLAVLSAAPAFTQIPSDEAISDATAAPVAHVYVQTTKGVDVFAATSAGKLTLVKGSPFATIGLMEAINGKYLISVGTIDLHVYPIESTGGLGKQVSAINTHDYGGSVCGTTSGAVLDHSGRYLYSELFGAMNQSGFHICSAWQTYRLESNGELVFLGDIEYSGMYSEGDGGDVAPSSLSTISSNDKFAYGAMPVPSEGATVSAFSTFAIETNGLLEVNGSFSESDPPDNPGTPDENGPFSFYPVYGVWGSPEADPADHMAVLMYSADQWGNPELNSSGSILYQIASYTIDPATGAISSTNDWTNMPSPTVCCGMGISPSGKLVTMFGNGVEWMHFNGSAPVTAGPVEIPSVNVSAVAWDKDNHLYALSYTDEKLYVFNATPTSVSEVAGSPYTEKNQPQNGEGTMIVVPKL